MAARWTERAKVDEYLGRVATLPQRLAGEEALVEVLPEAPARALDLGCGDGRLTDLLLRARPGIDAVVAVDNSPPMLAVAEVRFAEEPRVEVRRHDLSEGITALGPADVVVSGFAIHHLAHERKQALFAEVAALLRPGGTFANLEVVETATPELQAAFYEAIGRPGGDPEDVLAPVEDQLAWMRAAGLVQVDCHWRWRGFALLVGAAPVG